MDCENCSRAIVRGLGRLPGLERVEIDLATKKVVAEHNPQQTSAETAHVKRYGGWLPIAVCTRLILLAAFACLVARVFSVI